MRKYYFYIARCFDNSLYVGFCSNLKNREAVHNKGKGAKYTKLRRPVRIVYFEEFNSLVEAMRREKQVKGWTRVKKEELIKK